jgi:hypothetical protein
MSRTCRHISEAVQLKALRFAVGTGNGARVWAIEGRGSYGAGLARYLAGHGETVLEVSRTP